MNLHKEIQDIKLIRDHFLKSFSPSEISTNDIVNAIKDINLQSIRIHKFITHNGNVGKVSFARFLSNINLDEQTRIMELNISNIEDIVNFIENI